MFKKRKEKKEITQEIIEKKSYSSAIIDYLRNDFKGTKIGIQSVILTLFEKNYLTIEEKEVNLGTPWAPNHQEIIQIALSPSTNPDDLTAMEDHLIKWLIFTFGDGVYTNFTQVLKDVNNEDFKQANLDMFKIYNDTLDRIAHNLGLIDDKASHLGLRQQAFYQEYQACDVNSLKLIYGDEVRLNPLLQKVLDLFDQIL